MLIVPISELRSLGGIAKDYLRLAKSRVEQTDVSGRSMPVRTPASDAGFSWNTLNYPI